MEENQITKDETSTGSADISPLDPFLQFFVDLANKNDNVELDLPPENLATRLLFSGLSMA